MNEEKLIHKIKTEGCSESLVLLRKRHENLILGTAQGVMKKGDLSQLLADFTSEVDHFLWTVVQSYEDDRGAKFSTWLCSKTRWHCQSLVRELYKERAKIAQKNQFTEKVEESWNAMNEIEPSQGYSSWLGSEIYENSPDQVVFLKECINTIHDFIDNQGDDKSAVAFKLRYLESGGRPAKQVAEEMGICKNWVHQLIKKQTNKIKQQVKQDEYNHRNR